MVEHQILGQGTFGKVALVSTPLHQNVAAKTAKADSPAGARALASVQHEVQLLSKLQHPNVVEVLGTIAASDDTVHGFVMPQAEGGTMCDLLQHAV